MSTPFELSLDEEWQVETTARYPIGLIDRSYSVHTVAASLETVESLVDSVPYGQLLPSRPMLVSDRRLSRAPGLSDEDVQFVQTRFYVEIGARFVDVVMRSWSSDRLLRADSPQLVRVLRSGSLELLLMRSLRDQRLAVLGSPPRDWQTLGTLITTNGPFAAATAYYVQGGDVVMAVTAGATGYFIWFVKPTAENLRQRLADRFKPRQPPSASH